MYICLSLLFFFFLISNEHTGSGSVCVRLEAAKPKSVDIYSTKIGQFAGYLSSD